MSHIREAMVNLVTGDLWSCSREYTLCSKLITQNLQAGGISPHGVLQSLWTLYEKHMAAREDDSGVKVDQVEFELDQYITEIESKISSQT